MEFVLMVICWSVYCLYQAWRELKAVEAEYRGKEKQHEIP